MLQTTLFVSCLFVGVAVGHILTKRDNNAEALIDEFIYETVQDLQKNHGEQITIPDIDENFEKKVAFLKIRGEFTTKGGWLRDLTTLQRKAPSVFIQEGNSIILGITLGLNELEFGFKEYTAEIFHIGIHGTMRVSVQKNSVYLHLNMTFDDNGGCKTTLDKVEVKELNGFHADMTGLGRDADFLYSMVASLLANKYHGDIERSLSQRLTPVLSEVLAKHDLCEQFPH
uniref:Putative orotidine 5'-phosphate decarboxylase n=1 Tax=Panstrongylus lignarius TaxID=156445 RepID=A0A224XNF7_9HEMI